MKQKICRFINTQFSKIYLPGILWGTMVLLSCCTQNKKPDAQSPGPAALFSVSFDAFDNETAPPSGKSEDGTWQLKLTWLKSGMNDAPIHHVLVSDTYFGDHQSAIIFMIDTNRRVVDQIRNQNGDPLEFNLTSTQATSNVAQAQRNMRVGTLLVESATQALQKQGTVGEDSTRTVRCQFEGRTYRVLGSGFAFAGYGPLPRRILNDQGEEVAILLGVTQ